MKGTWKLYPFGILVDDTNNVLNLSIQGMQIGDGIVEADSKHTTKKLIWGL